DRDEDRAGDLAELLYETALITSGFQVESPKDYAAKVFTLMKIALGYDILSEADAASAEAAEAEAAAAEAEAASAAPRAAKPKASAAPPRAKAVEVDAEVVEEDPWRK
ncbi:Heat shock protein HSP 90-alpha, partial [Tetrabaena socialis]